MRERQTAEARKSLAEFTLPVQLAVVILCGLAVSLASCSGGMSVALPPVSHTAAFVFVSNIGSNTISAFQMDAASGALTSVPGSPFAAGAGPEFLAADAAGKFLFVGNSGSNTASAFQIDAISGALTSVPGSPFLSGARPEGLAVDAQGRFLFVGNQAANSISVFNIAPNGGLTQAPGSPFAANNPFGLALNVGGTILFANNFPDSSSSDLNTVSAFQVATDGTLTPSPGSPFPTAGAPGFAASVGLAADHAGKFLFVGDHMAQAVVPFTINAANGALTPGQTLPTPPSTCGGVSCHNNPLRLAVHPNDRFVFASNVAAGTVSIFSVLGNGALSSVAEVQVGQHPFGIALDPTGTFLFVVNKMDNTISAFTVNAGTGMLTSLPGSPFAAGGAGPVNVLLVAKR